MVGRRTACGRVAAAVALLAVNGIMPGQGPLTASAPRPVADTATACSVTVGTATTDPARAPDAARALAAGFAATDCMPDASLLAAAEARAAIALGGPSPETGVLGTATAVPTAAVAPMTSTAPAAVAPTTSAARAPVAPSTSAGATATDTTAGTATITQTSESTTSGGTDTSAGTDTSTHTETSTSTETSASTASGDDSSESTTETSHSGSSSGDESGSGGSGSNSSDGGSNAGGTDAGATFDGTTTAAGLKQWGPATRREDFDGDLSAWTVDDGTGQGGKGRRAPSALSVANGVLTISGDANGTTAGLAWGPGATHGRWEARIQSPVADPTYHAVMELLPDQASTGSEVDVMDNSDPTRQKTDFVLHHSGNSPHGQVTVDATQWHDWAVEWSPGRITAYLDGQRWFTTTRTSAFPPGAMHLVLRLDWFPTGGGAVQPSTMKVDWVRFYPIDGSGDSGTIVNSGDSAAGATVSTLSTTQAATAPTDATGVTGGTDTASATDGGSTAPAADPAAAANSATATDVVTVGNGSVSGTTASGTATVTGTRSGG
jgi:hypothetical protein